MRKLFNFLFRPKCSELAIETFERQISLAERQKIAKAILGSKWIGASSREASEISVEFGPPPRIQR